MEAFIAAEPAVRILVVDDQREILALARRALTLAGYAVSTAESADQALSLLSENWDIVISDISMPGKLDGIGLLKKAREISNADVLIMTGAPELDSALEALRSGAYDYLFKPLSLDTLVMTVHRCVEKRTLSRDLARERMLRAQLDAAYHELRQMERVKHLFGQYVTPEVAQFLLTHPDAIRQKGERVQMTLLFADVRQFTPFSESAAPEEVVDVLNQIFSCVTDAVSRENGIVNKFIGDGVLALFGAPLPNERHVEAAARAAIRMRDAVEGLAHRRESQGLRPLRIGIGVNTGEVVAGCLGSNNRAEYSVIGHPVNLASRLVEEVPSGKIYLGPDTVRALPARFRFGVRDPLDLPGISRPVIATELLEIDEDGPDASPR